MKYALSLIDEDIERRRVRDLTGNEIQPVERISTLELALAALVKSQNLEISQFYPPLPEHIKAQRRQADLERYARHLFKDNFDPYRGATELPLGGRVVGD